MGKRILPLLFVFFIFVSLFLMGYRYLIGHTEIDATFISVPSALL